MSQGAMPDVLSGGIVVRNALGVATNPVNVPNAYVPSAAFTSSAPLAAWTNDCTAKFDPAQLNAIVSELIALAEALNPTGAWTNSAVNNVATKLTAWLTGTGPNTLYAIIHANIQPSADSGNTYAIGSDGLPFVALPTSAVTPGTYHIGASTITIDGHGIITNVNPASGLTLV